METTQIITSGLSTGMLILRVIVGLVMAAHGAQKLFGWFGGYGLTGTGEFMVQLGFKQGRLFATAAALSEFGGGLLVALGFLGPVGPALIISVMFVAAVTVHWKNGLFATANGIELPLLFGATAVAIALIGPGRYSLDAVLGITPLWTQTVSWIAIGAGLLGAVGNLALRHAPPKAPAT